MYNTREELKLITEGKGGVKQDIWKFVYNWRDFVKEVIKKNEIFKIISKCFHNCLEINAQSLFVKGVSSARKFGIEF